MEFGELYKKISGPNLSLSDKERQRIQILIVDSEQGIRNSMRQALVQSGYQNISDAPNHVMALEKIEQRHFTHVIFECKKTNMPVREFLQKAIEYDDETTYIPSSYEPTVDDVFDLLVLGAKGYVVKPFTTGTLDEAIVWATRGEPISDSLLYAKNRNEALASFIMTSLDKLALVMRQADQFETAKRELPKRKALLKRAMIIGLTFAKNGEEGLRQAMMDFCLERGRGPATRIGRARKRLDRRKKKKDQNSESGDNNRTKSLANIMSPK